MQTLSNQKKVRCFGGSAALTIEATQLDRDGIKVDTLNIELAPVHNRQADWSKKTVVQLSEDELPVFAAVLLGQLPLCEFKRSGKGIFIERQPKKLFFKATEGAGKIYPLPVGIGSTFRVSALALEQLQKMTGLSDGTLIIEAIKGSAALYRLNK